MRDCQPGRRATSTLLLLLALALTAAACASSDSLGAVGSVDTVDASGSETEGIVTNDGGIVVKPPDVLSGETEVVDGQDTTAEADASMAADAADEQESGLAPDSSFVWFDGSEGSIADLQGKPTVLNFWATSCAACVAEMPDFEVVYQDLGDRVAFVGMNTSDRRDAAERLATRTGVTYPLASDDDGSVFRSFQLFVMPTTILLSEQGEVAFVWAGLLTEKQLRIVIDEHIAPGTFEDV